ncbi:MAG TPA: hypothetical protein VEL28_07535 [Candidatus Binatia bacterium]|nr:hypothetical protein [Candidatus Binatia bacterium]
MSSATKTTQTSKRSTASRFARTRARSYITATRQDEVADTATSQRTPERALMMAVLEDAIACYAGRLKAPRENPQILRRQAEHWLQAEDWDSPFSFNNVCDALALDPKALRQRILR